MAQGTPIVYQVLRMKAYTAATISQRVFSLPVMCPCFGCYYAAVEWPGLAHSARKLPKL